MLARLQRTTVRNIQQRYLTPLELGPDYYPVRVYRRVVIPARSAQDSAKLQSKDVLHHVGNVEDAETYLLYR